MPSGGRYSSKDLESYAPMEHNGCPAVTLNKNDYHGDGCQPGTFVVTIAGMTEIGFDNELAARNFYFEIVNGIILKNIVGVVSIAYKGYDRWENDRDRDLKEHQKVNRRPTFDENNYPVRMSDCRRVERTCQLDCHLLLEGKCADKKFVKVAFATSPVGKLPGW